MINAINLPEKHPGDFDRRFYQLKDAKEADEAPIEVLGENTLPEVETLEYRRKVSQRIRQELAEAFASHRYEPYNVFVPTFAPQYAAMVARGGRPGSSVDDSLTAHEGVWVPFRWLNDSPTPNTWKQAGT